MNKTFLMSPAKHSFFAFLILGLFVPVARCETEIVSINDSGFLHIRETKSDSAADDHYISFPNIISISIYDEREHGFSVVIRTVGIRGASGNSTNVMHSLDFETREDAEDTVRQLLDAINSAK